MLVKLDNCFIRRADLQVDLGSPDLSQQRFCRRNNRAPIPAALKLRRDRQVIEPASAPFVTGHHTRDNFAIHHAHQKQIRPHLQLPLNISLRIIPRSNKVTLPPKCYDRFLIVCRERPDLHVR